MRDSEPTALIHTIERALNGLLFHLKRFRIFPFAIQGTILVLFTWTLLALVQTNVTAFSMSNAGMHLFWHLWWPLMPFLLFFTGAIWCAICPFALLAAAISRICPGRLLPDKALVRHGAAIGMAGFCTLMVMDITLGISASPRLTAWMLFGLLSLVMVVTVLFDRHTYCYTICPFGFFSRLYGRFSLVRMQRKRPACLKCQKNRGIHGTTLPRQDGTGDTWKSDAECLKRCKSDAIQLKLATPWRALPGQRPPDTAGALLPTTVLMMLTIHIFSAGSYFKYLYTRVNAVISIDIAIFTPLIVLLLLLLHALIGFAVLQGLPRYLPRGKTALYQAFIGLTPLLIFFHMALVLQDFDAGAFHGNSLTGASTYALSLALLACGFVLTHLRYRAFSQAGAPRRSVQTAIVSVAFYGMISFYLLLTLVTVKYAQYYGC